MANEVILKGVNGSTKDIYIGGEYMGKITHYKDKVARINGKFLYEKYIIYTTDDTEIHIEFSDNKPNVYLYAVEDSNEQYLGNILPGLYKTARGIKFQVKTNACYERTLQLIDTVSIIFYEMYKQVGD